MNTENLFSEKIKKIEKKCSNPNIDIYETFNDISDDVWAKLLFDCPVSYQNIIKILPSLPNKDIQKRNAGITGSLMKQRTPEIYQALKKYYHKYSNKELKDSKVLDFGCGWGRIIRLFLKDIPASNLFGVDPKEEFISVSKEKNLRVNLAVSNYIPNDLPFDKKFNLIYAYSVFTHLSEKTHFACLKTLYNYLEDHGVFIASVRPREFLSRFFSNDEIKKNLLNKFDSNLYAISSHVRGHVEPDGEITQGDCAFSLEYIKKNWSEFFLIKDQFIIPSTPLQVLLVFEKA